MRKCAVPGCSEKHHANGLCNRHKRSHVPIPPSPPEGEWREIPGYGDHYYVTRSGEVWGRYYAKKLVGVVQRSGHIRVLLRDEQGRKRGKFVHQLVLEAYVGPRPANAVVRHLDGNPANNALDNLTYGTSAENAQDRLRHGTDANARKTECKRGHSFTAENTRIRPDGSRKCRTCDRQAWHRRSAA